MALIPKAGAWIMIRQPIPVEFPIDPFSFFFAVPTGKLFWKGESDLNFNFSFHHEGPYDLMNRLRIKDFNLLKSLVYDYFRSRKDEAPENHAHMLIIGEWVEQGKISEDDLEQQVRIKTTFGDVSIQPNEYTIIEDMTEYMEAIANGEGFIRYISNTIALKGKISDQIFYLRTRGISYYDALQMCIQNIKTQNLFYIEMHPVVQKMFHRNWDNYWAKKLKYCMEKNRTELLNYGPAWDFSQVA